MIRWCLIVCICILSGCATKTVKMNGLTSPKSFLVSKLKEVDYPSFMAAEGNIYSCRYGIAYKRPVEFMPPRDVIFAGLLYRYYPAIKNKNVELHQFDIYYNNRLKLLDVFGRAFDGVAGSIARDAAERGKYGFMDKNLLIDSVPETFPFKTEEIVVGCDNANEGEYYPSRVSGGHDVAVIWLRFSIDNKQHHFRALYQFQPEDNDDVLKHISIGIEKSIKGIVERILI